jgi:hypothetical protein
LKAGRHLPAVRGAIFRQSKLRDLPGNAVIPRLQEILIDCIDCHANEPMTGKRQLSKGATP